MAWASGDVADSRDVKGCEGMFSFTPNVRVPMVFIYLWCALGILGDYNLKI